MRIAAVLVLAAAVAVLAPPAGAVNILIPGQKAFGVIGAADEEDLVYFRADAGAKISFVLKARKGETLLPLLTSLEDPQGGEMLPSAVVKTNRKGTLTKLKFTSTESGFWRLGIGGDAGSTGTWDLASKGPKKVVLGSGTVSSPGALVPLPFDADDGTEATIQVKASLGSLLRPLVSSLQRPASAGPLDLSPFKRKTTKKSDTLKKVLLPENGSWTLVVTGAESTTGAFDAFLRVGKKVPLDFSVDPPTGPPPTPNPFVASVAPATAQAPLMGTSPKSLTVTGSGFVDPCTVTINAPSGTNGITNVVTTFVSSTSLTVNYDLDAAATGGPRSVTATNPDLKAHTRTGAFTVMPAPTHEVTAVTPSRGSGAGGTRVLVQGNLFLVPGATVSFGGVPAQAVNVVDAQSILCTVPPAASVSQTADIAVDVSVDNGGGQVATLAGGFTYDVDPNPPRVLASAPAGGATGVPRNLQRVVLIFTEPMDPAPIGATNMSGTLINWDYFRSAASGANDITSPRVVSATRVFRRMVVLQRGAATGGSMSASSIYVTQTPAIGQTATGLTDVAGNLLDPFPFVGGVHQTLFTTGGGSDLAAPTIASNPANGATAIDADVVPIVSFNEAIDPTTLAATVQFVQGATPVPFDMDIDVLCRNVSITPTTKLAPNTAYTVRVLGGVTDLSGNVVAAPFNATFTTAATDGTAPAQTLTVDSLPSDLNGSGTFAAGTSSPPSGSGAATPYDAYLPLSGFTIDVLFGDAGGSGIDPTSFSCTCSAAMGATGAGQQLASNFTVDAARATWTVDAGHALAAGNDIVFTVDVSDYAGNAAVQRTLAIDAADITKTPANGNGNPGNDRDPFNSRQSWLLRFDQDIWTVSAAAGGGGAHPNPITVGTVLSGNGMSDFEEDLRLIGLNGNQTGTNAASVTNGPDTGTNAIVRRMVREALRRSLNRRYGIAADGTRGPDSVEIEFLLEGETKAGGGTVTAAGWSGSAGYSMMTFTGDERPNSTSQTLGRATFDQRNRNDENDSNTGDATGNNLGTFATNMVRLSINDAAGAAFPLAFDPLISLASRGGAPVGTSNLDAIVLAGSFDYASATGPQRARFDLIMRAIDRWAMYLSAVGAHEIGHSTGLVRDGAPPGGLFGNAHPNNTFVDPAGATNSAHLDVPGPNIMAASSDFGEAIAGGTDFMRFEPLSLAYLLRRHLYDN